MSFKRMSFKGCHSKECNLKENALSRMRSIVLLVFVVGIVLAQEGTAPPPYGCANGEVPDCSTCPKSPCGNGGRK